MAFKILFGLVQLDFDFLQSTKFWIYIFWITWYVLCALVVFDLV